MYGTAKLRLANILLACGDDDLCGVGRCCRRWRGMRPVRLHGRCPNYLDRPPLENERVTGTRKKLRQRLPEFHAAAHASGSDCGNPRVRDADGDMGLLAERDEGLAESATRNVEADRPGGGCLGCDEERNSKDRFSDSDAHP